MNRISERNKKSVSHYPKDYPITKLDISGKLYLQFSGFRVSSKNIDNCCLLKDGTIAIINKIYIEQDTTFLSVKHFEQSEPFFTKPCNSNNFSIVVVQETSLSVTRQITPSEVKRKCLKFQQ